VESLSVLHGDYEEPVTVAAGGRVQGAEQRDDGGDELKRA